MLWLGEVRTKDRNLLRGEPYSEAEAVSFSGLTRTDLESRLTIDKHFLDCQTPSCT